MNGYIRQDGTYYEADEAADPLDYEIPLRPSDAHIWNGAAWVISPEFADAAKETGDADKTSEDRNGEETETAGA